MKSMSKKPLKNWLLSNNFEGDLTGIYDNFTRSCAAYCVATYVLGIGDRHNDNIMVTKVGHLFHIDFAHFLGNIMKFGFYNREKAPFVLTPEFVHVMGDEEGDYFRQFIRISRKAYVAIRQNAHLFISLFHLMLSTGISQLEKVSDIYYLRDAFSLLSTDEDAENIFEKLIFESLECKTTQINFLFHNMVHNSL